MYTILIIFTALFCCGVQGESICDQKEAAKCTQPALKYFLQRYGERKAENVTDAKWRTDMLKQCELDQSGRTCLKEYEQRCLPQGKQISDHVAVDCQVKVDHIMTGCQENSSAWYKVCETPLQEQLYAYLTYSPTSLPSQGEITRVQTKICCEIDHYIRCVNENSTVSCKEKAVTTFHHMFKDINMAYRCDSSKSFKDTKC